MSTKVILPSPGRRSYLWKAIADHYNLPALRPNDKVTSMFVLPKGWRIQEVSNASREGTIHIIFTETGKRVGSAYLKKTTSEYKGWIGFDDQALRDIGIDV